MILSGEIGDRSTIPQHAIDPCRDFSSRDGRSQERPRKGRRGVREANRPRFLDNARPVSTLVAMGSTGGTGPPVIE